MFKGVATAGAKRGFEDELPEDEKAPDDPPPPPPPPSGGMHWDGPPQRNQPCSPCRGVACPGHRGFPH
jgi:hypothetical protein